MPKLGAHLSIAGGLHNAVSLAGKFGCDCLQMFVKNQRQWKARPLTDEQVHAFKLARQSVGVSPVVVHDNYLINLACPQPPLWKQSCDAFLDELDRCTQLEVDMIVTHPGSHLGLGEAGGIARIAEAIGLLMSKRPALRTQILLENTAGQGHSLGHRFEQLAEIIDQLGRPSGVGVCLDTCHLFAAGYDIRTPDGVAATLDEFSRVVGLDRLRLMHLNDSKRPLGSRVDRHEHIGRGEIGLDAFRAILNDPRLALLPMVIETPKDVDPETGLEWDQINLDTLRRLRPTV